MKNRVFGGKNIVKNPLFKRLVAVLAVLFCVNGVMWGTPFRWKNSTSSSQSSTGNNNWDTSRNWDYYGTYMLVSTDWHVETNKYPGKDSGDDVYFFGEADSTCNVNIPLGNSISNMYVNLAKDNPSNSTGTANSNTTELNFSEETSLTVNSLEIAGGTFNLTGTGTLNVTGTISIADGATLNIDSGVTVKVTGTGSITGSGTIVNEGTLSCSSVACKDLTVKSGGSVTVTNTITASGDISNSGTIDCNSISCDGALNQTSTGTIKNCSSITAGSIGASGSRLKGSLDISNDLSITCKGPFYNGITIDTDKKITIQTDGFDTNAKVTLSEAASSITIDRYFGDSASESSTYPKVILGLFNTDNLINVWGGKAVIKSLELSSSANAKGKTLEIKNGVIENFTFNGVEDGKLDINESPEIKTLSISGVSGHLLTVGGTGTITSTQRVMSAGNYLTFKNADTPKVTGSGFFVIDNSTDSAGGTSAFPAGWKVNGSVFIWQGNNDGDISRSENWDGGRVPSQNDGTEEVLIETVSGGTDPVITSNLNLKSLTVSASSILDLNGNNLTLTGTLINSGKLTNTSAADSSLSIAGDIVNEGVIEKFSSVSVKGNLTNTGTLTISDSQKLLFNGDGTSTQVIKNSVEISGNIEIASGAKVSAASDVSIKCKEFTNNGTVSLTGTLSVTSAFTDGTDTSSTYEKLELSGDGTNTVTVTGSSSLTGFVAITLLQTDDDTDKKPLIVSFVNSIKADEIKLEGKASDAKTEISGSGTIIVPDSYTSRTSGKYLSFTGTGPVLQDSSGVSTGIHAYLKESSYTGASYPAGWADLPSDYTWTGAVDSDWNQPGNWFINDGTVPVTTSEVVIPDCTSINVPETGNNTIIISKLSIAASGNLKCNNGTLTIKNELSIANGGQLSVTGGNVKVLCDFTAVSGTKVSLTGGKLAFWKSADFSSMSSSDWENTGGTLYWYNNTTTKNTIKVFNNQIFKTVNFAGNLEIQLNGTIKADTFNMGVDNDLCPYLTNDQITSKQFTVEIKNGTKLEVTQNMDVSRSATGEVRGLCQVNINAEFISGVTSHSGTIFQVDSGKTITLGDDFTHVATSADLATELKVKGTLDAGSHDIILTTGTPDFYSSKLNLEKTAASVIARNITFAGTYNNGTEKIAVNNIGTINVTGTFKTPSYDGTGKVCLNGDGASFVNLGTSAVTISTIELDSGVDTNRTLDAGEGSITVISLNAKVTGLSLTTKGSANTNEVTVTAVDASSKAMGLTANSGKLKLNGNISASGITVNSGAVFETDADVEITLSGDLDNKGTFTSKGTVLVNKSGTVSINGNNSFKNLTINPDPDAVLTVSFEAGKTQTVSGSFTSEGATGKLIILTASGTPDVDDSSTWWKIDVPAGNVTLSYTNVEYSSSTNAIQKDWGTTVSESVTDSTLNWFIRKFYWFGKDVTDNSDWSKVANWSSKEDTYTVVTSVPPVDSPLTEIVIKENSDGILKLTGTTYTVKSFDILSGTKVNLNGKEIISESFVNNGTVTLGGGSGTTLNISKTFENGSTGIISSSGTETVILPDTSVSGNSVTESGTWEFTGGKVPVYFRTGKTYNSLVINGTVTLGTSGADPAETVSAVSAEIKSGKTLSLGNNNLSLTGALSNAGILNVNGTGNITTGTVTNSGTIDISSSGTIDKLNSTSGLVKYSGSAAQTIQAFTYYNLELANTSTTGLSVTDNITVANALSVSKNSTVSVASGKTFTVSKTTDTATGSETLTLTGAGSATFTGAVGGTNKVPTLTASVSSLTFGNTVSIGTLVIDGTTTLVPGTSAEFTNITINDNKKLTSAGNIKLSGTFSDLNTAASGLSSFRTVTFTGAASSISTVSGKTKFNNIFVSKGKKLTTSSSFEVGGNFELESDAATPPSPGTFTATSGTIVFSGNNNKSISGKGTFNNVTFAEDSSVSLSAGNTFNDLTFEKGSTVTFTASTEQTVNGKIVSNGTGGESGKPVTLKSENGQWSINFDQEATGNKLEYLNITNSKFTGSNGPAVALHSTDSGNNVDWIFPGHAYTWTADASANADKTKWNVKENWSPATVPGKGAVVTIPKGLTKYPVLEANLDLYYSSSAKGYIITEADGTKPGSLDLSTFSLIAGEVTNNGVLKLNGSDLKLDKLTNNGLLKLKGTEIFAKHGTTPEYEVSKIVNGADSTVEYYENASAVNWLAKSTEYKNLIIDSGTVFTVASYTRETSPGVSATTKTTKAGSLTNNGKVIVPSDITLEFGSYTGTSDSVEVTGGTITQTGSTDAVIGSLTITTKAVLNGTTTNEKTLSATSVNYVSNPDLETSGNVKLPGGSVGALTVSSGNLSVTSAVTCTGAVSNSGSLTLGTTGSFENTVTNSGTINAGTGDLTFSGNYTGTSGSLVGKSGAGTGVKISFEGDVTFGTFTNNGEKVILSKTGDQSLTTNGQSFAALTFEGSGTKTVTGDIKASSLTVGDGTTGTTVTNATGKTVNVTVSGDTTVNASSSLTISGSGSFAGVTNNGTINLGTGDTTFAGNYTGTSGVLNGTLATTTGGDGASIPVNPLITFKGNVSFKDTTGFVHNGDFVKIISDSAQTVVTGGNSFAALTFEGSGTKTVTGDIKAASLVVGDGTKGTTVTNDENKTVNVTVSGITTVKSSSDLTISGSGSFAGVVNNGTFSLGTIGTVAGEVTNTGTINAGTGDLTFGSKYTGTDGSLAGNTTGNPRITFNGDVKFGNFTHNGDSVLFTSSSSQTLTTNDQIFASVEFKSTGTDTKYTVTGLLHVQGDLTNTKGLDETVNLKISGDSTLATTKIIGVKKVNNFTVENTVNTYTKTVLFPASGSNPPAAGRGLTVTGNFTLSGKDRGDDGKSVKLSAQGTPSEDISTWWYLESVDASKVTVSNAEIGYAYSAVDISSATSSNGKETLAATGAYTTYHWFAGHKYYWFGGAEDNKWITGGNWSVKEAGTPVLAQGPKHDDETITVYIKGGAVDASAKQLILENSIIVKEFQIDSGIRVDLKNYTVNSDKFVNNGILVIDGSIASPLIKAKASSTITQGTDSTIEYKGWTGGTAVKTTYAGLGFTDSYINLLVEGIGEFKYTDAAALKTSGTFVSGSGVTKITTNAAQTFGGTVTLNDSATGTTLDAGTNSITLNGNVTSSGNITFASPVVLGNNILIQADAKDVTFSKTVTGKDKALTLGAADHLTGNITFTGDAGELEKPLGNISIYTADGKKLTLQGAIYTSGLSLNGSGLTVTSNPATTKISVTGPVTVNNSGTVSVSSPVDILGTSGNLTVKNGTTLSFTGTVSVAKDVTNNGTINNGTSNGVSVTGNITNSGTLKIGAGSTVTVSGNVTNNTSAVIGSTADNEILKVAGNLTDNGDMTAVEIIIFNGSVSKQTFAPNTPKKYKTVKIENTKDFSISKDIEASEIAIISTVNADTKAVTAGTLSVIESVSVKFNGNVDVGKFFDSTSAGNISFNGSTTNITEIGSTANPDILLTTGTVTFNNTVTLGDNLTHTAGETHFGGTSAASLTATGKNLTFGKVVLNKDTTISANNITFSGTADSKSGETYNLSVTGTGDVTFKNTLGKTRILGTVNVTGNTIKFASGCTEVTSTGSNQTWTGPVTLEENCKFTGKNINFTDTIDGTKNFTINGSGSVTFNNTLGNSAKLGTVSVKGSSIIFASGCTKVTSTDFDQTWTGPVTLNENCEFTGKNISFQNTVSGAKDLTVNGSGIITLENGCTIVDTTSAVQTWNGALVLKDNCVLKGSDITFESTVDGTYDLTVQASGTGTFRGNVGGNTKLAVLKVTGASVVIDKDVNFITTTESAQTWTGPVTLIEDTAGDDILLITSSGVTFNGTVTGPRHITIDGPVVLNGEAVGGEPTVKTEGKKQLYKNTVSLTKDQVLKASLVQFDGAVSGNYNLTVDAETLLKGSGVTTTGKTQHYKQAVVLGSDNVLTGKTIIFDSTVDGTKALTINGDDEVNFNKPAGSINALGTVLVSSNDIVFKNGCTSVTSTGFDQTWNGKITLQENLSLSGKNIFFKDTVKGSFNFDVTGSESITVETTTIETIGKNQHYIGKVVLKNNCIFTADKATFNSSIDSDSTGRIFKVDGNAEFNGSLGVENALKSFEVTKNSDFVSGSEIALVTTDYVYFDDDVNCNKLKITNGGLLKLALDKVITVSGSLVQDGEGKNLISGSIVTSSSVPVSFNTNVYVSGNPVNVLAMGGGEGVFALNENLIISLVSEANKLEINSPLKAKNIVLYSGDLFVNKNIESSEDIILLGPNYSDDDGVNAGEYKYEKNRACNYNYKLRTSETVPLLPSPVSSAYKGVLDVSSGVSIKTNKNFYANGLTMRGIGQWFLDTGKNADPEICFVEAYNCDISNSTVRNFGQEKPENTTGVAEACTFDNGSSWSEDDESNFGSNRNWDFAEFRILEACTVSDNVIYVKLSSPMRNIHKEFYNNVSNVFFMNNGSPEEFVKLYKSFAVTDQYGNTASEEIGNFETDEFYIQTMNDEDSRWNTDATGLSSGNGDSTDSWGKHQTAVPSVAFKRSGLNAPAYNFTNRFGKILKNSGSTYSKTLDKAHPVLIEVLTGQEIHNAYNASVGQESQHSYDAHNFMEFRMSEAVNLESGSDLNQTAFNADSSVNVFENQKVETEFGAIYEKNNGLEIKGFAEIQKGKLITGKNGTSDKTVHGLYRKEGMSSHAVRISVAGLTEGTVNDNDGNLYKNWIGYIDNAETPSGNVIIPDGSSSFIKDNSGNQMNLIRSSGLSVVTVSSYSQAKDFGLWDTAKPVFAAYRKASREWAAPLNTENYEAVGSTVDGTSSLKRLEFHLFDNAPEYNHTEPQWVSKKGWVAPFIASESANPVLYKTDSYASDKFGGSRAFDDSDATSGGIRYSSISDGSQAFLFTIGTTNTPDTKFEENTKAYSGASSPIFQPASSPSRSPVGSDSLYFGYKLPQTILSLKTQFTVKYDDQKGFITDLAGNRLESATIRTMDLTPPSVTMTVAPVGQKKIFVMFSKVLETGKVSLVTAEGTVDEYTVLDKVLPQAFELCKITGSSLEKQNDIQIDSTVPAKVLFKNTDYMGIELALTKETTYENIRELYLVARQHEGKNYKDPVIDLATSYATFIQDDTGIGNYLPAFSAHAMSDFAVNLINPVYAYNEKFTDDISENDYVQVGVYGDGSYAVHDWDAEQNNFGTLFPDGDVHIISSVTDESSLGMTDFAARVYMDNTPDAASVSVEYNRTAKADLRVWLPEIAGFKCFSSISEDGNKDYKTSDSEYVEDGNLSANLDWRVPEEFLTDWGEGSQVSFMFGLTDVSKNPVKIVHSPEFDYSGLNGYTLSEKAPLFALRLKNPSDILSLDLWSFKLKKLITQKGNVTILNNVINATTGEKTVLRVDNPSSGKVDVIVMTLDGDVIDYLNRGQLDAGITNFTWNGKNRMGKMVARGMYFIRVIGNGFDETRKVMVVK